MKGCDELLAGSVVVKKAGQHHGGSYGGQVGPGQDRGQQTVAPFQQPVEQPGALLAQARRRLDLQLVRGDDRYFAGREEHLRRQTRNQGAD
jgi:hypothetical protein